jgi:aspartyl-tRNA(Asn)/glutamyl-tRNA(Gln) amidotransferase subunit A
LARLATSGARKKSSRSRFLASRSQHESAFLSIEQAGRLLRRKEISPVDLVESALERIERLNPSINAFLMVLAESARREAKRAERAFRRGAKSLGPLYGIPISLKDNFWTRGIRTTAGSKILEKFVPERDSEVAIHLARAGAILLGKTNMHEFAYGITNDNPHFGPTRNPWNRERITGGSSGGSAAAVALGMGFAATGTDTGGSIRIPSALCGVVGLKPTFGLVSVEGVVPLAVSLDHAGPIARSVTDACILLEAMAGKYPKGAMTPDFRKLKKNRPRRFRLGWPKEYFFEHVDGEVRGAIDAAAKCFKALGARMEEVSLPHLDESADAGTNIALAEATRYHESQGYFPVRAADYGDDVRRRLEQGRTVFATDYLRAFEAKRRMEADFDEAFKRVDAIIAPTLPVAAPCLRESDVTIGKDKETVRSALVRLNRPANVTGHPALSIPCGFTRGGLPIGLQMIGPRWGEARLLAFALAYEEATDWHNHHPESGGAESGR